jgi:hypothetical protein
MHHPSCLRSLTLNLRWLFTLLAHKKCVICHVLARNPLSFYYAGTNQAADGISVSLADKSSSSKSKRDGARSLERCWALSNGKDAGATWSLLLIGTSSGTS